MTFYALFFAVILFLAPLTHSQAAPPSAELRRVFIELKQPALSRMVVAYKKEHGRFPSIEEQKAYTAQLKTSHHTFMSQFDSEQLILIRNVTASINGVQCWVKKTHIHAIKKMPNVKEVRSVGQYPRLHQAEGSSLLHESTGGLNYINAIGADKLHSQGFTGKGKTIAILDTGVNYFHQSLGGVYNLVDSLNVENNPLIIEEGTFPNSKVIAGTDFAGVEEVDDFGLDVEDADPDPISHEGKLPDGTPDFQHGTLVAAVAAGSAGLDVLPGVAPDAKIIAIKVFADFSLGFGDLVGPIEFALDPNQDGSIDDRADVMNLSLGTPAGSGVGIPAERIAFENAHALGVIVVASAGNRLNGNLLFGGVAAPSSWPTVISVGASEYVDGVDEQSDPYYQIASFSISGPDVLTSSLKPDLSAPGVDIPFFNNTTARGTSFSSPIVAGLAALLLDKYPDFTPDQIKDLMVNSTKRLRSSDVLEQKDERLVGQFAPLRVQGVGTIQADKAFELNSMASPSVLSFGFEEIEKNTHIVKEITITNLSDKDRSYTAKVEKHQHVEGVRFDIERRFSVPKNSQKTIELRMRINPTTLNEMMGDLDFAEIDGWVTIEEGDDVIRAGYLALIKPTSRLSIKRTGKSTLVFNKGDINSLATPYITAPYQNLTYGSHAIPEELDVPQLGIKVNNRSEQAELEVLVAYNETRPFTFIERNPLTLELSLNSNGKTFRRHITLFKGSDVINYIDPNFTFIINEKSFSPGIVILDADQLAKRAIDPSIGSGADINNIEVLSPRFSNHFIIKVPLDDVFEGATTFNAAVSTRPNLFHPFNYQAQSEITFDVPEYDVYQSEDKGRVGKADRVSTSQAAPLNYVWLFENNSASTDAIYPNIVFEKTAPLAQQTDVITELLTVTPEANLSVVAGTVKTVNVNLMSPLDVPITVSVSSSLGNVSPADAVIRLLPNVRYELGVEVDASQKAVGDSINDDLIFIRSEDGLDLGVTNIRVPVTDTGLTVLSQALSFNATQASLTSGTLAEQTLTVTNTLNVAREIELVIPDLIRTSSDSFLLQANQQIDILLHIDGEDVGNNTYFNDVIVLREVGSDAPLKTIPVTVNINGIEPQEFDEVVDGVIRFDGKVGEPIDKFLFFDLGSVNPETLPLLINISSDNPDFIISTTDDTLDSDAAIFVEISYIPEQAGPVREVLRFDLGGGVLPFEYTVEGNIEP